METFEEFLERKCFEENPQVLDDDMPDFFDNWLAQLDGDEWMALGQEALDQVVAIQEQMLSQES